MATAKTKIRKTFLVLLCMILVYSCAGHSFLGPGISQAITTLGTITATDVVSPIGGQAEPMGTSASQVKNVLVRVTMNRPDIRSAVAEVYGINTAKLHKYNRVDITLQQLKQVMRSNWITENGADVIVQANNYQENQHLVDLYFNLSNQETTPLDSISCTMTNKAYTVDGTEVLDPFRYTKVLMGDANSDGDINAEDTLAIMKDAVGKLDPHLSAEQRLAADVNFDGQVNAQDVIPIQNYAVEKIDSFWDEYQLELPNNYTGKKVYQGWYRIKNAQTGQYIMGGNTQSTKYQVSLGSPSDTTQSRLKFKLNLADANNAPSGSFSLRCLSYTDVSLYLKLDSNYQLTMSATSGEYLTGSGHWFLLPQGDGTFRMVNRAAPKRALTDFGYVGANNPSCEAGYSAPGSTWILEPIVTLTYYYDNGFQTRYGSCLQDIKSDIRTAQLDIAQILTNVFDVEVHTEAPVYKQSYADQCTAGYAANCPETHNTTASCIENYKWDKKSSMHHKSDFSMLRHLYDSKTNANEHKLFVMFSGHIPCSVDKNGNHSYGAITGSAITGEYKICQVFRNGGTTRNDGTQARNRYTALHEISHCLGAWTGDELTPDTEHGVGCVMSYNRSNSLLANYWDDTELQELLYCNTCRDLIRKNLYNPIDP